MINFAEAMEYEENITKTENGAKSFKSTKNYCLDLFALGSSARNMDDFEKRKLVLNAFKENPLTAMKIIFYIRDIRGGTGERDFFRFAINELIKYGHGDSVVKNINLIPIYGRWDDIYVFEPFEKYHKHMKDLISFHIELDLKNMKAGNEISLIGKWLKSENTSSKESKRLAKFTIDLLGYTPRHYRKTLSSLRKYLKVVERDISAKNYDNISYENIPSRASMVYREAFKRNDKERYDKYIESVSKGEKKINTNNILPHEICHKILDESDNDVLEVMWNNLPDYINEKNKNALVMADVSGSMMGLPMEVSVSTALYFAERCEGVFKNLFMTFSSDPSFVKVDGVTLYDKMRNIKNSDWGYSTDINKAFKKILGMAVSYNIDPKDMPKSIFIISDMQFNQAEENKTNFQVIAEDYMNYGYEMPKLIFWNVDARNSQVPVTKDENGTTLVSGFSPIIFSQVISGTTPEEYMKSVIETERYSLVRV